jgi:hypothetical protein
VRISHVRESDDTVITPSVVFNWLGRDTVSSKQSRQFVDLQARISPIALRFYSELPQAAQRELRRWRWRLVLAICL